LTRTERWTLNPHAAASDSVAPFVGALRRSTLPQRGALDPFQLRAAGFVNHPPKRLLHLTAGSAILQAYELKPLGSLSRCSPQRPIDRSSPAKFSARFAVGNSHGLPTLRLVLRHGSLPAMHGRRVVSFRRPERPGTPARLPDLSRLGALQGVQLIDCGPGERLRGSHAEL
jgi:hypothetical protein